MQFPKETAPRILRHQIEHKKLSLTARQVAGIHPLIDSCEPNDRLFGLASKCGFEPHDVVGMRVWMRGAGFTVIVVPLRLWHKPLWFRRALELRDCVRRGGQRCIIAPASVIMRQPRLTNARLVAACVGYTVRVSDQLAVMGRLLELGGLSLQEASGFVDAKDPAAAILSMVSKRQLSIDISKPIGPHSQLSAFT